MEYYTTNKLYELFHNSEKFKFSTSNIWELVYGNENSDPLLLALLIGIDDENELKNIFQKEAYSHLEYLSKKANLPLICVAFKVEDEINEVYFSNHNQKCFSTLKLDDLAGKFKKYGLQIKNSNTNKYLNDKTSSAYHKWQRDNLGNKITVSDIDLWVVDIKTKIPIAILEIKRSKILLQNWVPFKRDYPNFKLLSNLCNKAGLKFKIVYYYMKESSSSSKRLEDISQIKVFDVDFGRSSSISEGKVYSLADFIIYDEWLTNK
ncbi:MAG: hypothetical protein H0Z22_07840 [Thermosipho sp. (in: Bacteria)]|nr:hypothetical protein [Thermosipho sp. (in: thermotogales)]